MQGTLTHMIPDIFGPVYERWTDFPPYPNTNDIIGVQYMIYGRTPRPNLELTSITWNPKGESGWWCGYGWERNILNNKYYNQLYAQLYINRW